MARNFSLDLRKFAERAGQNADQVVRKTAIELASRVALRTPVDTGRARANWQTTVGAPASGQVDAVDPSGAQAAGKAAATLANYKAGPSVFITNNLPYIEALEDGHSMQAPAGMMAVTQTEFQSIVANAARKVKP